MTINNSMDPNRPDRSKVKMSPGYMTVQTILFLIIMCVGWGTNSWEGVLIGWILFFAVIYRVLRYFNKIEPITIQGIVAKINTIATATATATGTAAPAGACQVR